MEVLRAWFGRAGVGAWRSRRQVAWAACVLGTVGVVYLQYAPEGGGTTPMERPSQRNALYREGQEASESPRVRFVTSGGGGGGALLRQEAERPLLQRRRQEELRRERNNEQNEEDLASRGVERTQQKAPKEEEEMAVPGAMALPQQESAAPPALNGGQYRYNPYGEPVYGRTDRPNYVPPHRVVHFDLKGAPPKMPALLQLLPWLKAQGATAVLLEYEDMFPFRGRLAPVAARNHYSRREVSALVSACRSRGLEVIPLVQTFGHLEFALKHEAFGHLREVPEVPQALCPSLNESMALVRAMVDQVMALHPGARFLHVGCDEVFHIGECDRCRNVLRETLFLRHVEAVAGHVRRRHSATPLVWDDMLRHVSEGALKEARLGELVEPVVWVYAEDVYRFVQPSVWAKYAQVFPRAWAASAFKGAFGEQLTVPNVRRHLDNNLNWLDVMAAEGGKFSGGFGGLVLTGWQRYDHFAVLCELLPAALPSLAVTLAAASRGFFNASLQAHLHGALGCVRAPRQESTSTSWLGLDVDPFLWERFSWCFFPGAQVFKITARLDATRRDVDAYVDRVTRSRGWISDYNRRHNFSSPMRVDEDLEELPARLHAATLLTKAAREALADWFDDWTVGEWLELHAWPLLDRLRTLRREAEALKAPRHWPARPLPILPELAAFGVSEPPPPPPSSSSSGDAEGDADEGGA